jgi:hypothetical protein
MTEYAAWVAEYRLSQDCMRNMVNALESAGASVLLIDHYKAMAAELDGKITNLKADSDGWIITA